MYKVVSKIEKNGIEKTNVSTGFETYRGASQFVAGLAASGKCDSANIVNEEDRQEVDLLTEMLDSFLMNNNGIEIAHIDVLYNALEVLEKINGK